MNAALKGDRCRTGPCLVSALVSMGITSIATLDAIRSVPRDRFVPGPVRDRAWNNRPLEIGEGQTISQPFTVARMIELADVSRGDRVLDVGGGSGYAAAVASLVVGPNGRVVSIEIRSSLAARERETLAAVGFGSVEVITGDGRFGAADRGPYDAILVAACADAPPPLLIDQLAPGGTLVVPVDVGEYAAMTTLQRLEDRLVMRTHGAFQFVPLV